MEYAMVNVTEVSVKNEDAREGPDRKQPACRTMRGAEILRRHLIGQ
jgi:hypothetical protein